LEEVVRFVGVEGVVRFVDEVRVAKSKGTNRVTIKWAD